MANLEEQLRQTIRDRLSAPSAVTPEQILENLDKQEQASSEYSESPEDDTKTLERLNFYRVRYGVANEINNERLVELLAENELLPDRPVVEDERSIWTIIRNVGLAIDSKYCAWTDSYTGKFVFALILAAILGFACVPGVFERREAYNKGYQDCKLHADVGLPCL